MWKACSRRYSPLFVHKEENRGEAGDEKSHDDGDYDDQVERYTIFSCQERGQTESDQQGRKGDNMPCLLCERCFLTFGRRNVEGHALRPGAVPC